ncbi:transposase [Novipirellula aureliae]|nr:transposase [Novipirellula aureliae]
MADSLPETAWKRLDRSVKSSPDKVERAKRANEKEKIVQVNGYKNQRLTGESYAEFEYRPTACTQRYRMIVVRKDIDVTTGQLLLRSEQRYFFYITNESASEVSAREVIRASNQRCDQENTISQLKGCGALNAPLNDLVSNMAYMLFASLSWTLKIWSGLLIRVQGNESQKRVRRQARNRILRMEYWTYLNSLMLLPAQVIRSSRQRVFRLLTYRPSVDLLMTMHDHISLPLRC